MAALQELGFVSSPSVRLPTKAISWEEEEEEEEKQEKEGQECFRRGCGDGVVVWHSEALLLRGGREEGAFLSNGD